MPTYIETIKLEEIEEHSLFSVSIIQVRERSEMALMFMDEMRITKGDSYGIALMRECNDGFLDYFAQLTAEDLLG